MPLIVMCGYPCSGKTRRAEELKVCFEQNTDRKVHIVDSQKEKNVRASLKAEVERKVNKGDIVILDSLNYIKGYRYELFCLIKHAQTPQCLVYCLTSDEVSTTWNTNRDAAEQYTQEMSVKSPTHRVLCISESKTIHCCFFILPDICCFFCSFDALVLRFEAPDSRNRWDSPLFTILKDDTIPFEDISDALFKRKAPPPNQSTQSQPLSSSNFLYELDKITQEVLMLTRSINMAELRKLRRQFISYTKMHPTENSGHISNMFLLGHILCKVTKLDLLENAWTGYGWHPLRRSWVITRNRLVILLRKLWRMPEATPVFHAAVA
ncbi:hypothetical protein F7725_022862 [Dissostichus mawsoni]|uniref:Protein KTI12 homolog n=1 Tax=Dissostichus mawsoni TaxID=36200 RepID=A0A7J5Z210_DISMA|nr:hypothetical protein F7725_022862 [Dissostichus mawsoni]